MLNRLCHRSIKNSVTLTANKTTINVSISNWVSREAPAGAALCLHYYSIIRKAHQPRPSLSMQNFWSLGSFNNQPLIRTHLRKSKQVRTLKKKPWRSNSLHDSFGLRKTVKLIETRFFMQKRSSIWQNERKVRLLWIVKLKGHFLL